MAITIYKLSIKFGGGSSLRLIFLWDEISIVCWFLPSHTSSRLKLNSLRLRGFFVSDFNNVLFTCHCIGPTIACWPILTSFERHLQSVTVLDNERDLPIVWSFQAIFSMELNGFQMEELARGRRQSKLLFLSDFAKVSLFSLRMVYFYRRWQTFWQVQYALNCCVR